ncbi:restriction endonuclease [Streptomyces sp. NPDC057695]|uniref:restriction endonuclease n=1 Tax=Streptomyces sp. NPDC057695 TaxID=3346217 RepID=UPI00367FB177
MTYGSVVHDPTGCLNAGIPLDRGVHERLAAAVLGWRRDDGTAPPTADIEQAALQLSGYAELQVRELHASLARLPREPEGPGSEQLRARITMAEAVRRLRASAIRRGDPLHLAQSRARLVDALHRALDRTSAALPDSVPGT